MGVVDAFLNDYTIVAKLMSGASGFACDIEVVRVRYHSVNQSIDMVVYPEFVHSVPMMICRSYKSTSETYVFRMRDSR